MNIKRLINGFIAFAFFLNYSGLGYADNVFNITSNPAGLITTTMSNVTTQEVNVAQNHSIGEGSINIANGYTVNVNFLTNNWSALFRDTTGNASSILGHMNSNGRVFIVNTNGVTFGAGSVIDMPGLVASTLDIRNADFTAGNNTFFYNGGFGSVIN